MAQFRKIYNRKGRTDKHGQAPLEIQIKFSPQRRSYHSLKIKLLPSQWDPTNQQILPTHPNHLYLNNYIDGIIQKLQRTEIQCIEKEQAFNLGHVRECMAGIRKTGQITLNEFITRDLEQNTTLAYNTRRDHKITLKYLNAMDPAIYFDQVGPALYERFTNYLLTHGQGVNTAAKYHKNINRYLSRAVPDHLSLDAKQSYNRHPLKKIPTNRTGLWAHELKKVEALDYPLGSTIRRVLDMFLFGCYTGLRFSDVMAITPGMITRGAEGGRELRIWMQKTRKPLHLPLEKLFAGRSLRVIHPYNLKDKSAPVFKPLSNQRVNDHLKTISAEAGLDKALTFHMARHTFLTTIAIKTGSIFLVMLYGGISKAETAQIYIHLASQAMASELDGIEW